MTKHPSHKRRNRLRRDSTRSTSNSPDWTNLDYCMFGFWVAILVGVFAWAYWPTLGSLVAAWENEPDYSHGYLVIPLAVLLLWMRRHNCPRESIQPAWGGVILIFASIGLRVAGAHYFLGSAVDGWSIVLWVAGIVWLLSGMRLLWWSLPSIVFLVFMIPLPYRAERYLSLPLQRIATISSSNVLRFFGQPALSEGNTILLGEQQLEVAQACSGLRMFVGIVALAFAFVIGSSRPRWEKGLLLASALPIALVANAARIVTTGLLYQYVSGDAARHFSHDLAGWIMIPFAACLFAFVLWYLSKLLKEDELMGMGELIRQQQVS